LAIGIADQERPSADKLLKWESTLDELATPVEQSTHDKNSTLVLTAEHTKQLSDLGQELSTASASLEHQRSLLEALEKETASLKPAGQTFHQVVAQRRIDRVTATENRIKQALEKAREQVENEQIERLARIDRLSKEAETARKEELERVNNEQKDRLTRAESERVAEETRVKEAQKRAETAGLRAETARLDAATERAKLEKEFERALPQIRTVLAPFISPGFQKRGQSKGEGPMSFAVIQAAGALSQTPDGRQNLADVVGNNDRPTYPLKRFRGGQTREEEAMCNLAQELLTKYGPLLVEKGLLAP
jgi:hypothetical protein